MTQEQLAQRTGFTQGMIAEIENGKRSNPSLLTIQKLAEGLKCRPVIQVQPEKTISKILDEQSTALAQKIISISSGSAAIEMQLPSQHSRDEQVAALKKDLLEGRRSALWQKI
jgi:transcriptional regulator with XRE-family HTH domain